MNTRSRLARTRLSYRVIVCACLVACGGQLWLDAQTRTEGVSSLGQLFGGFFSKSSYVGATPVSLARFDDHRSRIKLHGFSIAPPADVNWFLAYSPYSSATIVQTVWFVKDPHLYSVWASGKKIGAQPSSLMARLEFYGASSEDFTTRVMKLKTAEWGAESRHVLAFDVRPLKLGLLDCADYQGRVVDRAAPPGFAQHAFVVSVAGRVCPHPEADGFVVDISHNQRTPEGEAEADTDRESEAFVQSLHLDPFDGPTVESILVMDRPERGRRANRFWVEDAVLTPDAVWVTRREPGLPRAEKRLTRIDAVSNQIIDERPTSGMLAGTSGTSVWLFRPGAGTDPTMAWRLDEGAAGAVEVPVTCAPGRPAPSSPFHAGAYGVWLGCQDAGEGARQAASWRVQRRLDPLTGASIAELAIAPGPVHGDAHLAWAEEFNPPSASPSCRVSEIDAVANRVMRTVSLGSFACEYLTIAGNEAWFIRSNDTLTHVDLTNRRTLHTVKLPKGRTAGGIAIGRDIVWVLTTPAPDAEEASARLGSDGGLIRLSRSAGTVAGPMIPTGTANRLIGLAGNAVWLHDVEGAIVKVRDRAR